MKPQLFILLLFIAACQNEELPAPTDMSCEWGVTLEPILPDSCFVPFSTLTGNIVPPITGLEIRQITVSPNDNDIIYLLERTPPQTKPTLYKLNLCTGNLELVTTFENYSNNHLRINNKEQIVYRTSDIPSDIIIYDIGSGSSYTVLSDFMINELGWVNDTSFIAEEAIMVNGEWLFGRTIYDIQGNALDTLFLESGEFSNPLNSKLAITGQSEAFSPFKLFIYDIASQTITATYEVPGEEFSGKTFILDWLDGNSLLIQRTGYILGRFNLDTQTTDIFFNEYESGCENHVISGLGKPVGDGVHLFKTRYRYYYDENDNFRLQRQLTRYNMETGVEEEVIF
ncbi:MAG: hypothetical protein MRY78_12075 [Saprospiraceae bacterium]|nr:hypothetical protein [Saprospiraceae bacterium]